MNIASNKLDELRAEENRMGRPIHLNKGWVYHKEGFNQGAIDTLCGLTVSPEKVSVKAEVTCQECLAKDTKEGEQMEKKVHMSGVVKIQHDGEVLTTFTRDDKSWVAFDDFFLAINGSGMLSSGAFIKEKGKWYEVTATRMILDLDKQVSTMMVYVKLADEDMDVT